MMGAEQQKFKVGDKVRLTEQYGRHPVGKEGVVNDVVGGGDDDDLIYTDTVSGVYARRLELVPAWQPKVGDRVVSNDEGTRGEVGTVVERDHYSGLTMVKFDTWRNGHDGVNLYGNTGNEHWLVQTEDLQPAPTFTIEAGKFYTTRDGRKVGPIVVAQGRDDPWPWKLASGTHYYRNDGHSCPGWADGHRDADDLIAEWVDEPTVAVAASNDNAAHPVGTKLRRVSGAIDGVRAVGDIVTVAPLKKGHHSSSIDIVLPDGRTTWEPLSHFVKVGTTPTAIVAIIEDGVAKPATKPRVHSSQADATAEAERLALLYPGQEFGVFVLAGSKIADVVEEVVKKTVLRAA